MKSLIKSAPIGARQVKKEGKLALAPTAAKPEAQCCAKVSKTIAGCHD